MTALHDNDHRSYYRVQEKLADHIDTRTLKADSFQARCPAHDDNKPSLSITYRPGRTLLHCFAGCHNDDILAAAQLTWADLFDDPKGESYTYYRADGTIERTVHRSPDKTFYQSGDRDHATLYNLNGIQKAKEHGLPVYLVEGESDVRTLEHHGYFATTAPSGAKNFQHCDVTALTGCDVIAVADLDEAGRTWAQQVRAAVEPITNAFTFKYPAAGKDIGDHIAAQLPITALLNTPPTGKDASPEQGETQTTSQLLLPAEWYAERPYLKEIRQYAHDHCAGADAVLYATMARLSAMISPTVRIDTGILSPASCNLFVAAMGPAGSGKSSSASLAKRHYQPNATDQNFLDGIPIGSGEGLVETYFGMVSIDDPGGAQYADGRPKQIRVKQQIRDGAFFVTDEGQRLVKLMDKPGSILADTIREMWVAATTGQGNANTETRRILDEHRYSAGMLVGFQPHTVQDLLKDWAGGTPQRFVYCWVSDPNIPDEPAPRQTDNPFAGPEGSKVLIVKPGNIQVAQPIRDEIRATHMARIRGLEHVDPMDAHDYLTKAKLAAILALMDNRNVIEEDDWRLAGTMYEISSNVRSAMVQFGQQHNLAETAEKNRSYAAREGLAESARQQAREEHGAPWRVAKNIAKKVHDGGLTTVGAVNRKLAARDQKNYSLIDAAWEIALDEGWVLTSGNDVKPGEQRPS